MSKTPTEPGWYWLDDDGEGMTPCRVWSSGWLLHASPCNGSHSYCIDEGSPGHLTWGGPCTPPTEDEHKDLLADLGFLQYDAPCQVINMDENGSVGDFGDYCVGWQGDPMTIAPIARFSSFSKATVVAALLNQLAGRTWIPRTDR